MALNPHQISIESGGGFHPSPTQSFGNCLRTLYSANGGLPTMKFTCSRCGEIFVKPHPAMLIVTGNRILFFCTVRCRDNFDLRSDKDRRCGVESRQFALAE
jgi:ribosomal protein L24E